MRHPNGPPPASRPVPLFLAEDKPRRGYTPPPIDGAKFLAGPRNPAQDWLLPLLDTVRQLMPPKHKEAPGVARLPRGTR